MLKITNKKTGETETVNAEEFYKEELEPMIYNPETWGTRHWLKKTRVFFALQEDAPELYKSQLRDIFRHLKPTYLEFITIIKKGKHPVIELSDNAEEYNREAHYIPFQLDTGEDIFVSQHFDYIKIEYINP